jgi:uncharacterized repeat protein (TIGR01451 family)
MAGLLNRLYAILGGSKSERVSTITKSRGRRKLRMEMLENRQLMAANITGTVFQDLTDNGFNTGVDPNLSGVTIALFRDGGNNTYDSGAGTAAAGDDIAAGTTTSAATTGLYSFTVNTAGTYYLVQTSTSPGLIQRPNSRVQTITVSAGQILGSTPTLIDSFDLTAQNITSTGGVAANSSVTATEAIGGERDLFIQSNVGGSISAKADSPSSTNFLAFGADALSNGTRRLVYDGPDNDATVLNNTGLGSVDLTAGQALGIRFIVGAEATASVTVTINSGTNSSSVTVPIPDTNNGATPDFTLDIPFTSFTTLAGTGANFASVGAITVEVSATNPAVDVVITNLSTYGPSLITQNIANLAPMSIGDLVFSDRNNNGLFDPTPAPTEAGVNGITLQLFSDTNNNGVFNPGTDLPTLDSSNALITTTTNASGAYTFNNLLPGSYFVVIPNSQFATGAPGAGYVVSSTTPTTQPNDANKAVLVSATGVVTSVVTLTAGGEPINDGDTNNNSDLSFDIGLVPQFDLTVTKTTTATIAATGSTITYTVTARNDGPATATGVTLLDDVPDGLKIISFTSNVVTDSITIPPTAIDNLPSNPADVSVTIGTLAQSSTAQRTYTIIAEVLAIPTGTGVPAAIVNTVSIAGLGTELTTLPNTASVSLPVQLVNDLVAIKSITTNPVSTATPAIASPGSTITYTIIGRNDGPSRATSVRLLDNVPDGIQILTVTSSDTTDVITTPPTATDANPTNNDDISIDMGEVLVGATNQTTFTITALVLATTSGLFTNSTTISSTNTAVNSDPTPANNTSTIQANAQRNIDLVVTKSIVTTPASTGATAIAAPGSTFTYTILARNDGPFAATTVQVTDNIPDGIRIVSASLNGTALTVPTTAGDTIAANNDDLVVSIGNLAVGAANQSTITIIGVVLPGTIGTFTNTAVITATDTVANLEPTTALANNTSSISASAPRTVDLGVTKSGPTTAIAGNTITYTFNTVNNGPSDATGVQVVDNIPDGIRVISATVNGVSTTIPATASDSIAANNDDITFAIGSLASTITNNTIVIVAAILPGTTGSLVNSSVISTTDTTAVDGVATNNTSTITTTLTAQNDVAISKVGPTTAVAGTQISYTLNVTNNGPSTATSVNVLDTLPAGLTFVSGTSLIGTTVAGTVAGGTNNTATVTVPALAPGETAIVTIQATVAATTLGNVTNTVTVTAVNDSVSTNNNGSAITSITVPVAANISGRLYIDSNNDGTGQATEPGISGVTVTLTGTPTGSTTPITPRTTLTTTTGDYTFTNVPSGAYVVTSDQPANASFRASNPGSTGGTAGTRLISNVTLAGVNSVTNNIGFTRPFSKRLFLASSVN